MRQNNIGKAIRDARSAAGLTRAQLATKAGGINRITVRRIETGETSNPRADTLSEIADALGLTVNDLLPRAKKRVAGARR